MRYGYIIISLFVLTGCQTQEYVPTEKNKNPRTWQEKYAHCHREPQGIVNFIPGVSQVNSLATVAKNTENPECLVKGWDASFLLGMNQQQNTAPVDNTDTDNTAKTKEKRKPDTDK